MKRIFDISLALVAGLVLAIPMLCVAILVRLTSTGPALHWSKRVGRDNKIFSMPKFRTMRSDTPQHATHLLRDANLWITPLGRWMRLSSVDESPQLWSILVGDMSFVGPRPALFNQHDLVELRTLRGIHELVPGVTGWAQINGRDELSIPEKVKCDVYYLNNQSFVLDLEILLRTFVRVFRRDGVQQADEVQSSEVRRKAA